jgi:cation:H+ antiporter
VFSSDGGGDTTGFVVANVLGSNITNILLIVGLSAVVYGTLKVKRVLIDLDVPLLILSAGLLALVVYDGQVTWMEGLLLIVGYLVYLRYSLSEHERDEVEIGEDVRVHHGFLELLRFKEHRLEWTLFLRLIVFGVIIYFGSKFTIDSLITIADTLAIKLGILAATVVALGTSLPELTVSLVAARHEKYEIAIGNVFGSNIFNTLMIVGTTSLFKPLTVSPEMLFIGLPFFLAATLLYAFSGINQKIHNFEGGLFLLIYILFIAKILQVF